MTNRRNDKIEIVLNKEEKEEIVRQAKKECLPVSTYIRWKLIKKQ